MSKKKLLQKRKVWYEFSVYRSFKGVILKSRKSWLWGYKQHLVLWRYESYPSRFYRTWIPDYLLVNREYQ